MKRLLIILLLTCSAANGEERECKDCPPEKPCEVVTPAGCNTCTSQYYCVNGVWRKTAWESCTTMYCGDPVVLNPFSEHGELRTEPKPELR